MSDSDDSDMGSVPLPPGYEEDEDMSSIPIPAAPHPLDIIPFPPDSSKYSPSQISNDDEIITSPGQCEHVSSTATKLLAPGESSIVTSSSPIHARPTDATKAVPVAKVLDRAQAKKRLMAFSAAKLQPVSTSSSSSSHVRKGNLLKGVSVFHPKEKKQINTLNIETIREDETKIKEIIAVNKILCDKLHQVNSITNDIKAETMSVVVNPLLATDTAPISESTVSESTQSPTPLMAAIMKPPSLMSRHLRKRSMSRSPSPGRSRRSRSKDRSSRRRSKDRGRGHDDKRSNSRRDNDRDRDKERRRSKSPPSHKARGRKSKSRSPIPGKVPRSKSPIVIIRKSPIRSASPSPKSLKRRDKDKSKSPITIPKRSVSRSKSPAKKDKERRTIRKSKSRSRSLSPLMKQTKSRLSVSHSRSRSKSPKRSSRKSRSKSPKLKSKKEEKSRSRKKSKRSRSRDREEKKRKEESKERRKEAERLEAEKKAVEKELDKVRLVRMPVDWTEYYKFGYTLQHIKDLHLRLSEKKSGNRKSSSRSTSPSPNRDSGDFSKALEKPLQLPVSSTTFDLHSGRAYPVFLVQRTKTPPSLSYGVNPYSFAGYYKTRKDILKVEDPEICHEMNEIFKAMPITTSSSKKEMGSKSKGQQEWFAANEQTFCPPEGKKGVTISHLFSEDEMDSNNTSPITTPSPLRIASLRKSSPEKKVEESEPEHDSLDSAPSPLLKKRYKESPVKPKLSDKKLSDKRDEGRRNRDNSQESDSSLKIMPRDKMEKKGVGFKPKPQTPESDDVYEMDTEDFPLEKEPVLPPVIPTDAEKSSVKTKEKKVKKQKKKQKKKKSKRHSSSDDDKSSDDDGKEISKKIELKSDVKGKMADKEKEKLIKKQKKLKLEKKRKHSDDSESGSGGNTSASVIEIEVKEDTKHQKKKVKMTSAELSRDQPNIAAKSKDKISATDKPLKLSEKLEKDDDSFRRKSKKDKQQEPQTKSKHKRRHDKKKGQSPFSSDSSDSEGDSESESSSSDHSSDSDTPPSPVKDKKRRSEKKHQKREKHKLSKKSKKRSKSSTSASEGEEAEEEKSNKQRKDKKGPDDKENDKRGKRRDGDGGDRDRNGGGGAGSSGTGGGGDRNRERDSDRGRDRKSDGARDRKSRDSGSRRHEDRGRRRNEQLYEDELSNWEKELHEQIAQQPSNDLSTIVDFETKKEKFDPDQKRTSETIAAHNILSQFDNDVLLQSVLNNEDLSAEALLKNLQQVSDIENISKSDDHYSVTTSGIGSSNWSDDSEAECANTTLTKSHDNVKKPTQLEPPSEEEVDVSLSVASILSEELSFDISVHDLLKRVGEATSVYESITEAATTSTTSNTSTTGPLLLVSHDSSSTDSDSSDSDSSSSSSSSSGSSSSSSEDEENPGDGEKIRKGLDESSSSGTYNPFDDVMSHIAAESKSTDEILTKVTLGFNNPIPTQISTSSSSDLKVGEEAKLDCSTSSTTIIGDKASQSPISTGTAETNVYSSMEGKRHRDSLDHHHHHHRRSRDDSKDSRHRYSSPPSSSRYEKDRYHHRRDRYNRDDDRVGRDPRERDRERYERHRQDRRYRSPRSYSRSRSRSRTRSKSRSPPSPRSNSRYHRHREERRLKYGDRREDRDGRRYYGPESEHEKDWGDEKDRKVLRDRERYYSNERDEYDDLRRHIKDRRDLRDWHDYPDDYQHRYHHERGPDGHKQYSSPPLQSNVADSTISDAELAANNQMGLTIPQYPGEHYEGNGKSYPGPPVFQYPMPFPPPPIMNPGDGQMTPDYEMVDDGLRIPTTYGDNSPPRRLSLDERLEREMGIKMDVPKKINYPQQGPYYHGSQFQPGGGQRHPGQNHSQLDPAFAIPPYWTETKQQTAPTDPTSTLSVHQQRQQCQIVQKGNVLQVMPTAIPNGSFTIHARVEVTSNNGVEMGIGASTAKRVVTIKVPVIPFAMPVVVPPSVEQIVASTRRMKKKRKHEKLRKKKNVVVEGKPINEKIMGYIDTTEKNDLSFTSDMTSIKEQQPGNNENEEDLAEIMQVQETNNENAEIVEVGGESGMLGLLENEESDSCCPRVSQVVQEDSVPGNGTEEEKKEESDDKSLPSSELELHVEQNDPNNDIVVQTNDHEETPPSNEQDGGTSEMETIYPEPKHFTVKFPLPDAGKGILVSVGFRHKVTEEQKKTKKAVKFADGCNPGYGTESSEGEEMRSPPPPSILEMEKLKLKKLKRKRDRAKRKRLLKEKEAAMMDPTIVPPPPSSPFPFCHPGVLYQVCPQYAVLYAQALAEKGFEIVFEGTHQIDQLPGSVPIADCADDDMDFALNKKTEPLNNPSTTVVEVHEPIPALINATIDASIILDLEYQPIMSLGKIQPSSNLIQVITESYDPCELDSFTPTSFTDQNHLESPATASTPPSIITPPNMSSPAKMFTSPIPTTPPSSSHQTTPPAPHFVLPRPLSTPPRSMTASRNNKVGPEGGSPIPILIRRANLSPPPVFPNALGETDLEGNALN